MRIVAGYNRGRILHSPDNNLIRPTSDKVRLALFNALNSRGAVVDAVVLDGFCGTGALALEALSQGASEAVLIDQEKSSLELARKNAGLLEETEHCSFLLKDCTNLSDRPENQKPATLCFLDPPYHKEILPKALKALQNGNWLNKGCWIVAEMEKDYNFEGFSAESEKTYGDTKILIGRI